MMPRERGGFTLIEVLVAVALSGILLAATYGVFLAAQRGIEDMEERLEQNLNSRRGLDRLKREIESLYLENAAEAEGDLTFLRIENREQFGEGRGRLAFTTLDPGRGQVLRYEYRLLNGILVKRGGGIGPRAPVVDVPYLEGIRSFTVEALSKGHWLPAWDTTVEYTAPESIRVTLLPEGGDEPLVVVGRPRQGTQL